MAPKLRGMLLEIYNVLFKFEIVAILLLVILPNFTRNSIIDFTRSTFLSIGLSHHRRQIGTTSAPPLHYVWMFLLERAVSLSLLIYYHWTTNFKAIVLGFYLMSTLCSSSIAYFMPTINCQELPQNPNLLVEEVEEIKRLRAENERLKIEKEALEDQLKVERLDHEDTHLSHLALEKRNQILEDKLKVERLEHEDTRLALESRIQTLEDKLQVERLEHEDSRLEWEARIQKENLKSRALSEEIDDHSEFEKQMVETIKTYNEECKRLALENKDIVVKLKDVTSAIGKDQKDLLDCQDILCKCKQECKEWKSENIALKIELEAANSWYQYYYEMSMTASSWNQYYMESENNYRHRIDHLQQAAKSTEYHHHNCLRGYDLHIQSLVEEIDHLSGNLYDYKECIADYKEKCRALEEEQDNLHAKLRSTIASCELYRSMLQDLASS